MRYLLLLVLAGCASPTEPVAGSCHQEIRLQHQYWSGRAYTVDVADEPPKHSTTFTEHGFNSTGGARVRFIWWDNKPGCTREP